MRHLKTLLTFLAVLPGLVWANSVPPGIEPPRLTAMIEAATAAQVGTITGLKAPNVINVTAPTEAAITAAVTKAKATVGGDIIKLPDAGTVGITVSSDAVMPMIGGGYPIYYEGIRPIVTHSGNVPDNDITFVGGTWFKPTAGQERVYDCFKQQTSAGVDLTLDLGSVDPNFTTTAIRGGGVSNVGIQDFRRAVSSGAAKQCGALWGSYHDIWIKGCTEGARFKNFQHCEIYRIYTFACLTVPQYYGADVPIATLAPGNSRRMGEFFDQPGFGLTDNQLLKHRGIVFEATAGSNLNELNVIGIQANFFDKAYTGVGGTFPITYAATGRNTPSNGYASFSGLGSTLQAGMSVKFTNVGGNTDFTVGQTAFIKNVSGDNVQFANTRNGSASTTAFTSNPTFTTYGFSQVEVIAGSGATVSNSSFMQIDAEGSAQGAFSAENMIGCTVWIHELFANPVGASEQHIVLRTSQPNWIFCTNDYTTDVDGSSTNTTFYGQRNFTNSVQNTGMWWGKSASGNQRPTLSIGSRATSAPGSFEQRNPSGGQFVYALGSMAQKIQGDRGGGNWNVSAGQTGYNRQIGSTTVTATMPDGDANDVGSEYIFANNNSGIMTISQNGTGLEKFRDKAALTSMPIPPATTFDLPFLKVKFMDTDGAGGTPHWWFVEESVCSYTYTPTLTNVTNVAASTASVCQFHRVGNVVTVSGKVNIDPTAGGATEMDMTLPYPSNLVNDFELAGTGAVRAVANNIACILGDTANDKAQFEWTAPDGTARDVFFTFQYTIK